MLTTLRRYGRSLTTNRTRLNLTLGIAIVGLLFWARLIVIADMPRTAVADPDSVPSSNVEPRNDGAVADDQKSDADARDETQATSHADSIPE